MPPTAPPYEPEIIERFAGRLEKRARTIQRGSVVAGAAIGGLFGSMPLTPLGEVWPVPSGFGFATFLLGMLAGALTGYVVGAGRAELDRLHAQTVLCQLHAQRATLAIWRLLREREREPQVERTPPPVTPPAPQRLAPAPELAPRPLLEPAPEPTPLVAAPEPAPEPALQPTPAPTTPAPPLSAPPPLRTAQATVRPAPPVSPPTTA